MSNIKNPQSNPLKSSAPVRPPGGNTAPKKVYVCSPFRPIDIEAMIATICAKTGLCKQSVMMVLDAQAEYLDAVCGEDEVDEDE